MINCYCFSSSLVDLSAPIWVRLADLAIRELTDTDSVWIQNVLLSIGKLYGLDT